MNTRIAVGFALLVWTAPAGASGPCFAEVVSSKSECGVRWMCGDASRFILKKDSCVLADGGLRSLRREDRSGARFPARLRDGTTFDVFAIGGESGQATEPTDYFVVVSRGNEVRGFDGIRIVGTRSFDVVSTLNGSVLLIRQEMSVDEPERSWTVTFDGMQTAASAERMPTKLPPKTFRGRVDLGARVEGNGFDVITGDAARIHVDEDGDCRPSRFGDRVVDVVVDPAVFPDGSKRHRCVEASDVVQDPCDEDHLAACDKRCEANDASACLTYGEVAYLGKGVREDNDAAAKAFWKACDAGLGKACEGLASMFFRGEHFDRNTVASLRANDVGCELGWKNSCESAANARRILAHAAAIPPTKRGNRTLEEILRGPSPTTMEGNGCSSFVDCRDRCTAGQMGACTMLGNQYLGGDGVVRSWPSAASAFVRACEGGNAPGCAAAGSVYANGTGVLPDLAQAERYFQRACEGFIDAACYNVEALSCPVRLMTAQGRMPDMDVVCTLRNRGIPSANTRMTFKAYRAGDGTFAAYEAEGRGACAIPMKNAGCSLATSKILGQTAWCCP